MVMEMPGAPFDELRQAVTVEALATQNMKLIDSTSVEVNGAQGLWVFAEQPYYGSVMHKQILITSDDKAAFMVVATYPEVSAAEHTEKLNDALMTLDWIDAPVTDVFEGLPFHVEIPPLFKGQSRLGGAISLAESDKAEPASPEEALMVIALEEGAISEEDAERKAVERAKRIVTLSDFSESGFEQIEIGGRVAYELTGAAVDKRSGVLLRVYQIIVPRSAFSYYIMVGMVGAEREEDFMGAFHSVARSFEYAESPAAVD